LAKRDALISEDPEELQWQFIEKIQDHPHFGIHFFYVSKVNNTPESVAALPHEMIIAFNEAGMHLLDWGKNLFRSFGYSDVYRWGGSSSQFSLIVWDQRVNDTFELVVTTPQASDMAAIIMDHIKAIMANQG